MKLIPDHHVTEEMPEEQVRKEFPWLFGGKKSSQDFNRCFGKEMYYVQAGILQPLEVQWDDRRELLHPVDEVAVSPSIFQRSYSCLDYHGCSRCCTGYWQFFMKKALTKDQLRIVSKGVDRQMQVLFNGQPYEYLCEDHADVEKTCSFLHPIPELGHLEKFNMRGCSIHEFNPITCSFPLVNLFIDQRGEKTVLRIRKKYFGRNWAMGCPVDWDNRDGYHGDKEEFNQDTLHRFIRWKQYLDLLPVPNRAGDIIRTIETMRDEFFESPRGFFDE